MSSQHLSDEAVAAFADGVLRGHARDRATRHVDGCTECRAAVRFQREAVLALRSAPAPPLPTGLFERLRSLPTVTPATTVPTVVTEDGTTMLATFARAAAVVPDPEPAPTQSRGHRRPFVTGAVAVILTTGALAAGSASGAEPTRPGGVHRASSTTHLVNAVNAHMGGH